LDLKCIIIFQNAVIDLHGFEAIVNLLVPIFFKTKL
jgi:hypothetical protein